MYVDQIPPILRCVGSTPLLAIQRLHKKDAPEVEILAKAEWFNPGGSVKDRPAKNMILTALKSGELTPGKIILDATSGNTGIALAMIGASLGFKVKLCLPSNASLERKKILAAYGAELVLTDPLQGSDGAYLAAREIFHKDKDRYFYVDQYNNPANWRAHYNTTGVEIWEQTQHQITHFVVGTGTSGTLMGVGRRLREFNAQVRIIGMQPDSAFHGLEGMKNYASSMVPGIYDPTVHDDQVTVGTEEAYEWTKRLAQEEGLFVGISSGANFAAAWKVAKGLKSGVVVTVFCDSGDKYLSDKFWEES